MNQQELNNVVLNFSNLNVDDKLEVTRPDIQVISSGSIFRSASFDFEAAGLKEKSFVSIEGFTEVANNGNFYIASVSGGDISVVDTLVDEIAGDSVTVSEKQGFINKAIMKENNQSDLKVQSEINALASKQHDLPLVS